MTHAPTPTLLFINGPVGVGKTTIAQRYVDEHRLSLLLSEDHLVGSMGQWLANEAVARELAFQHLILIAAHHLRAGYDVVVPFLMTNAAQAQKLQDMALQNGAAFFECALLISKEEMIERAISRGTWGEPGSPPLTKEDVPILTDLFDRFSSALNERPDSIRIISKRDDIDGMYKKLMEHRAI